MNQNDLQVTESLRSEIIERLRLRTQINWFKVAALGGMIAWNKPEIASWIIPIIAISFDYAMLHNALYIHQIGDFLAGYPSWRELETRPGQKKWVRVRIDLADRVSYLIVTAVAVVYCWITLKDVSTQPHWLKCWWWGFVICLLLAEMWLAVLSLIRWPASELGNSPRVGGEQPRERGAIKPEWISAWATVVVAVCAVLGLIKIENILNRERTKAVENHTTWVEMQPVAFESRGERDPADATSTFWYLVIEARNLGSETALVRIGDWSFVSEKRGSIKKDDYKILDTSLSLPPGNRIRWMTSFVMNPDYHIPALVKGEDVLVIKYRFESQDMAGKEEETYQSTWKYTRGKFALVNDNRQHQALNE